jgi:hypothetical protein
MAEIPPPPRQPPLANSLPPGARASAWPDLSPTARQLMVNEFLAENPNLRPWARIDFERRTEPLFIDDESGDLVSLAGQVFPQQGGGDGPLELTITKRLSRVPTIAWLAAAGALILLILDRG